MSHGVLYVGTLEQYFDRAVTSAKSVKEHSDAKVAIITSEKLSVEKDTGIFDDVLLLEDPEYDLRDKVYNLDKSPYDKTLYLDGDTLVIHDIAGVFDILEKYDFAAARALRMNSNNRIPDAFPGLNSGVFAYNLSRETVDMIKTWQEILENQFENGRDNIVLPTGEELDVEEWSAFGVLFDQTPLREALYQSDLDFHRLPPEYNFGRMSGRCFASYYVKILHGDKRHILKDVINKRPGQRRILWNGRLYYADGRVENVDPPIVTYLSRFEKSFTSAFPVAKVLKRLGIYDTVVNYRLRLSKYAKKINEYYQTRK